MRILHAEPLRYEQVATAEEIAALDIDPARMPDGLVDADVVMFLTNHQSYAKLNVYSMVRALKAPGIVYDGWHVFRPDDVLSTCPCVYMGLSMSRSSVTHTIGAGE